MGNIKCYTINVVEYTITAVKGVTAVKGGYAETYVDVKTPTSFSLTFHNLTEDQLNRILDPIDPPK